MKPLYSLFFYFRGVATLLLLLLMGPVGHAVGQVPTQPLEQLRTLSVSDSQVELIWQQGSGLSRSSGFVWGGKSLIVLQQLSTVPPSANTVVPAPVQLTAYAANTAFGAGAQIAPGHYVVLANEQVRVTVTNLRPGTTYQVRAYSFNVNGLYPNGQVQYPGNALGPYYNLQARELQFTTTGKPLPVSLVSFTGRRKRPDADMVELRWTTATELNNAFFEVQKAGTQGNTWLPVGTRPGLGTSSQPMTYSFTDQQPQAAYYRLRQVDTDGQVTFSSVVFVTAAAPGENGLQVHPNPAQGQLLVSGHDHGRPLRLYSAAGQLVRQWSGQSLSPSQAPLTLGHLSPGLYLLRQGTSSHRLIIE